jgi:CheY-like chemotaxis protein
MKHDGVGRVLVVDDDPAMRLLHAITLEAAGLIVIAATDGRDGLRRALRERPDVVVSDVSMPKLDGFELAAALRGDIRTHGIPFVFVSGESGGESRRRAYSLGAAAFVTKPFDPMQLTEIIVGLLDRVDAADPRPEYAA